MANWLCNNQKEITSLIDMCVIFHLIIIIFRLQITITAALGFDSFLVMRHGAGPCSSSHDSNCEAANALSTDLSNLVLTNRNGGHRLGCYFCNDVVAPIDVIFIFCKYDILQPYECIYL